MSASTLLRAALRRGRLPPTPLDPVDREVLLDDRAIAPYAAWLGVPADRPPLTWLYPLAQTAHLELLIDPAVRAPVVGMVHAGNAIAQVAPLPSDRLVELTLSEVAPIAGRRTLQMRTAWRDQGRVVAAMRSTYLVPGAATPGTGSRTEAPPDPDLPLVDEPTAWPASAGRAYAKVAGDYNPIHLAAPLARLLGQRGAIAHGMAAAAIAWRDDGSRDALQEVTFRRPIVLPTTTCTHRDPDTGTFRVVGADGTVHARGRHGDLDAARAFLHTLFPE